MLIIYVNQEEKKLKPTFTWSMAANFLPPKSYVAEVRFQKLLFLKKIVACSRKAPYAAAKG